MTSGLEVPLEVLLPGLGGLGVALSKLGFERSWESAFSPRRRTAFARSCRPRLASSRVDGTWWGGRSAEEMKSCKSRRSFMSPGSTDTGLGADAGAFLLRFGEWLLRREEEPRERDEVEQVTWWSDPVVQSAPWETILNLS